MKNPLPRTLTLLALVAFVGAAPAALAQVYKWTDKDGKVHYSSDKPPEVKATELKVDAAPASAAATSAGNAAPTAPAAAAPTMPNDDVNAQLAALDQQRCNAAKAVATRYETAPYLQKNGPDGKPVKLSVEEEAAERLKVKADVERLCKGK